MNVARQFVWLCAAFWASCLSGQEVASTHWAYRLLELPSIPSVPAEYARWVKHPIDAFILEQQHARGLTPSPEADRRTWLRRVTFDLIGLPPTEDEVRRFLAELAPGAHERVVDQLLASPRYGERWARHWMDQVHYAETHGHDQDRPREHAWPYRDFLIRAFNQDLPYQVFTQAQIAGDVLFPNDPWSIVATGFLATGPWDESSLRDIRPDSIDRLAGQYVDRDDIVSTTFSTFLSTTAQCARCHDHKFDPISQREYYGLQSVFAGTDKANRAFDWNDEVARERHRLVQAQVELEQRLAVKDQSLADPIDLAELRQWEFDYRSRQPQWQSPEDSEIRSETSTRFKALPDGSFLTVGEAPEKDSYELVFAVNQFSLSALLLEVLPDESLPEKGAGRAENGNFHLTEIKLLHQTNSGEEWTPIKLENPESSFEQSGWGIAATLDRDSKTGWGIHPEEGKRHRALFPIERASIPAGGFSGLFKLRLEQEHGRQHLMGRFRVAVTDHGGSISLPRLPDEIEQLLSIASVVRTESQRFDLLSWFLRKRLTDALEALPAQALVYAGTSDFEPDGSFKPAPEPRAIHVLSRGDVLRPGEEVEPGVLGMIEGLGGELDLGMEVGDKARRKELAEWISSTENGLYWRSIVNRVWLHHFGRGLVSTPNDFGKMGTVPSHPELLEWLAATFRDSGGSFKDLHRAIVTSATYRQSAAYDSPQARLDSDNRFLWRMNRRRLDGESIRDAILAHSGELDLRMGGSSDKQFLQSKGVHVTPNLDYVHFDPASEANRRRSVYRFIFRTIPDPFMEALDCPDASLLTPQRQESLTALQALAVLNDKFVVYQSQQLSRELGKIESAAQELFHRILGRDATEREENLLREYAKEHGWANACRFLWNSNEFIFVD